MTYAFYNFLWKLIDYFLINYLNFRVEKGKEIKSRLNERFGNCHIRKENKKIIWIHGSSGGESVAALALAHSMLKNGFDKKKFHFLITTNTVTSSNFVNNKIKNGFPGTHQFNPLDNTKFVNKFLDFWTPEMAIFVESDFWPNLIYRSSVKKIPLILASSQMSIKSSRFWRGLGRGLAKKVFKKIDLVLAVDPSNAELFKSLGSKKVKSLTSLKSIAEKPQVNIEYILKLKSCLKNKNIFLAASTHPGEEEILIKLANNLRSKGIDNIIIVITPRHIERGKDIKKLILSAGYDIKCRSNDELPSQSDYFYLADTMGEMGSLIEISNLVFVAGSLVKKIGGHNPIEAASLGKAVIMGPYTEKCDAQINDLVWSGGAIKIENSPEFKNVFIEKVISLLNQPLILEDMGKNALDACSYAQLRADEASDYLLEIFKNRSVIK